MSQAEKPRKAPPDERFWKKYSPHYELPISSASSVVAHALIVTLIVLGAALAARLGWTDNRMPEVETIVIAGGGGNPQGVGTGPNTGIVPQGTEAVNPAAEPPKIAGAELPREDLKDVKAKPQPILPDETPSGDRLIEETQVAVGSLSKVGEAARTKLNGIIAGKGKGGTGEGGGKGKGKGTGEGDLEGPGKNKLNQREKRQLRWTMIFNTRDGGDYLRQLNGLGAILAVPGPDGQYLVIRDLMKRPVDMKPEELSTLDRIYWIDDRPQSVMSLARSLGLSLKPDHVAAFFPQQLEKQLLDLELKRLPRGRSEDEIMETKFQILPRGGGYDPVVVDQKLKGPGR
jgi:hypothetical protein